ncbi:Creatinase/aminopeptidase [Marasmius fiardii PR-910]|nr:Creatinase/aminopeptidase [Marasmius fiardii PR-910]
MNDSEKSRSERPLADNTSTISRRSIRLSTITFLLLLAGVTVGCFRIIQDPLHAWDPVLGRPQSTIAESFSKRASHCANVPPISEAEFDERQHNLANALQSINASAYIVEPGASAQYFWNVSTTNWKLSERPLLFVLTAAENGGSVQPNLTILAPMFEKSRASLLPIPFDNIQFILWPEEQSPYEVLTNSLDLPEGNIFVDGAIRFFIVDGIQKAYKGGQVLAAPAEITKLRERKSSHEIDLMRCANEATLLAIREVHKQLHIGILESEARNMIASALTDIGLENGACLTLFGSSAALPHGDGGDRQLGASEFALFDCTATLHGYFSDVTRTVALPDSQIPENHTAIWNHVRFAQDSALAQAHEGVVAKTIDAAARSALAQFNESQFLTHRLGHGIGLEGHESPYLNGGSEAILAPGNCFSDEPGVYIEGEIGVRLEDCFCIDDSGQPALLTQGVGGQASNPLSP